MSHRLVSTKLLLSLFSTALLFTACLKEADFGDNDPNETDGARARIEITDAPIDDANVESVFITVADIKIDGKSWEGFDGKTTFDLLALQSGQVSLLGEGALEAGTHSQIVLVLDTEEDEDGDSPGCYVLDAQGVKRELNGGREMEIQVRGNFTTKAQQTTEAVIEMDLRKSVIYQSGSETEFQFVTAGELEEAARILDKSTTGNIEGMVTDGVSGSDKIVVYAYHKGDFATSERLPQGTSQITFKNAVTSTIVASDGTFNLAFLEDGNYELHFVSYEENADGNMEARGELQMSLLTNTTINLLGIAVEAKQTVEIDLKVTALVFF